ncbi:MAG: prolyl oligopeptidase family serine peptidase, partial [Planctomycetaceae bacterium]
QEPASEVEPSGPTALRKFLNDETRWVSGADSGWASSPDEWAIRQPQLHQQYLDMLGLWPLPEKTPLAAKVTGELRRPGYVVEKLHFQSRPGLYVTANLYRPDPLPPEKLPAVLYVCGHSGRGRDGNKTAFQHHGQWFATHGYVCLIVDTLQLGEIPGIHHGTYQFNRWWWHSAGYTPAGVECWNGVRALDYLESRPEVDAGRLAVTGISGGGAATLWIAAADPRVKVCVPVSGMADLQSYVTDSVVNGHCDCMFLYNNYRWEWTTIAALVAPRAMLFQNSGHDPIFPMPANERIRSRLEAHYALFSKKPGELFDIGVTPGGHEDNLELRLMAYRFINRHLKDDNRPVQEPPLEPLAGADLRAFPTDADLPADRLNDRIDETFVARASTPPPADREAYDPWTARLKEELLERVFRDWPDEVPAALARQTLRNGDQILQTDESTLVRVSLSRGRATGEAAVANRVWLLVLNEDEPEGVTPAWAKGVVPPDVATVLLSPRGSGEFAGFARKNPPNTFERSLPLLGRTLDTMRVWDVQAVARWIHETQTAVGNADTSDPDADRPLVVVAGRGPAGVLGAYAALFDTAIAEVALVEPPATHREGPHFLSVLRVLDVPQALGLLPPRRLTLVNPPAALVEATGAIYRTAGWPDRVVVKPLAKPPAR